MRIRKKNNSQVTIYFDKEEEYNVDIDLNARLNEDPDFDEPLFWDMGVTVSRIDETAIEDYKLLQAEWDKVKHEKPSTLIGKLKNSSIEKQVIEQGSMLKEFLSNPK